MRRRIATCMQDLVRLGLARPVYPTTDSGYRSYPYGRRFLPAAHGDNDVGVISALLYSTNGGFCSNTAGTVALRARPGFASTSTSACYLWYLTRSGTEASYSQLLQWTGSSKKFAFQTFDGTANKQAIQATSPTFSAGSAHGLCGRFDATTVDLCVDGAHVATADRTGQTIAHGNSVKVAGIPVDLCVGPLIQSVTRKTDGWAAAITEDDFSDPVRLFHEFMSAGDVIFPLAGDSVGYVKLGGTSIPFLDAPRGQIVFDGDSLTLGTGATSGYTYPQQCAVALGGNIRWTTANTGVGGRTWATGEAAAAAAVDALYNAETYSPQIVVAWFGTNDCYGSTNAATIYANLQTYCASRRAVGWKVIVGTICPTTDAEAAEDYEEKRLAVNANIAANWASFADGFADWRTNPYISLGNYSTQADYWYNDSHLNSAGYAIAAGIVKTTIESLL